MVLTLIFCGAVAAKRLEDFGGTVEKSKQIFDSVCSHSF